jgi:POT family proton-dependent oligopeptide transporter
MNQPVQAGKHPKGLYILFFTEMWERFGYYLMVGILLLFLTNNDGGKGLPRAMGSDVVGTFIALVYLTPFIGGLIADRYLGYIKSIFIGGTLMAAGYLTIALPGEYTTYIAMGLIIIGNGFFKPNISTLLGIMYNTDERRPLKDNAYNIFYMGINIGAFFCNFVAAILRNKWQGIAGWQAAFSAAGIGLIIGLITLAINLKNVKEYDVKKPMQPGDMPTSKILSTVFLPMIIFAIIGWMIPGNFMGSNATDAFIFACIPVIFFFVNLWRKEKSESDKKGIGALLFVFAVSVIFWTIYNQNSTGLTIWAESHTDRSIPQFMEKPADAVHTLQTLETKPQEVDSLDKFMRVVTDDSGHAIKTMGPDPYFVNLPKDKWPPSGIAKVGNTELFQSINPIFIVALTPLLILFFAWRARRGKPVSTASKFAWALIISGLSALVMVLAVMSVPSIYTHKAGPIWLFLTYGVFTVSEICLSPIGLSFVSKLAPQRLTALMMGGWFISTSLGGKVAGVMATFWDKMPDKRIFFGIIAVAAILGGFLIFAKVKSLDKIVRDKTGSA